MTTLLQPLAAALQRSVPPQWGRSFTVPNLGQGEQAAQLVRITLDRPQDVVLYLDGLYQSGGGYAGRVATHYTIAVGCGGISLLNEELWVPAVGKALHYTADHVEVVARVNGQSGVSGAGELVRVAAAAALGRPSVSYRTGDFIFSLVNPGLLIPPNNALTKSPAVIGWFSVNQTTFSFVRVPPFATRMRVQPQLNAGNANADVSVRMVDAWGDQLPTGLPLQHPTAPTTDLNDWTDFHELTPNAMYIAFYSSVGGVAGVGKVLVEFEVVH
jgi:hypothetical protein